MTSDLPLRACVFTECEGTPSCEAPATSEVDDRGLSGCCLPASLNPEPTITITCPDIATMYVTLDMPATPCVPYTLTYGEAVGSP